MQSATEFRASLGMENQSNFVRITRGAKKRAAAAMIMPHPSKKRVVLGELPNLSNIDADPCFTLHPKCKFKKKERKEAGSIIDVDVSDSLFSYSSEIYHYLRRMEKDIHRRTALDYIQNIQKDVTANMRGILVDWLVEVAEEYKLVSDTLYLTVSYVDRFLSSHSLPRNKLQLLGVSCMLVASKYEEISPPHVDDFCYITDNTYSKEDVLLMESDVLKALKFEMGNPTVKSFLRMFTKVAQETHKNPNLQLEFLGYFLGEMCLLSYGCINFLPSQVAAAIVFISIFTLRPDQHPWNPMLQQYSGYKPSELKECVTIIQDLQMCRLAGSLKAVRDKYRLHKFKCVSLLSSPQIPSLYFEDL